MDVKFVQNILKDKDPNMEVIFNDHLLYVSTVIRQITKLKRVSLNMTVTPWEIKTYGH